MKRSTSIEDNCAIDSRPWGEGSSRRRARRRPRDSVRVSVDREARLARLLVRRAVLVVPADLALALKADIKVADLDLSKAVEVLGLRTLTDPRADSKFRRRSRRRSLRARWRALSMTSRLRIPASSS